MKRAKEDSPSQIRPRLLSIGDAATYLGRSDGAVRELIFRGRLPAVKIDRRVQVDIRDLEMLIEKSKVVEQN